MLNPTIHRALSYLLYERRLKRKTIIEWQLGVCPDWQVLATELVNAGKYKLAEACGLLSTSEKGRVYDFLHHRITVPIHNTQGQVVAFGGRSMPDDENTANAGKYHNSPESPVYAKSKVLFGLYQCIKTKGFAIHGCAFLIEGYFDVIQMHQGGFNCAVASCGTALTEEQAKLLRRYTDTVVIMRDGDKAGRKAVLRDIPLLIQQQFTVYLCEIPKRKILVERIESVDYELQNHKAQLILSQPPAWQKIDYKFIDKEQDPDDLFTQPFEYIVDVLIKYTDAVEWLCDHYLYEGRATGDASKIAEGIDKVVQLLAEITNQVRREQYIKTIARRNELKPADLTKPLAVFLQKRAQEAEEAAAADDDEESKIPAWVDKKFFQEWGFAQLTQATKGYKLGIYFPSSYGVFPATNFVIKPLYHIYEQSNNRRLVEVDNGHRCSVVEMPSQALVNKTTFESVLTDKGNYDCEYEFQAKQFSKLKAWLKNEMPIAYELKSLGWQPEGFFAFANAVYDPATGELHQYDDNGMITVANVNYLSPGNSRIHRDERGTDNPYENDMFLKYVKPKNAITFGQYTKLFSDIYQDHAPYGLAFIFLTLFKDIVTTIAKMPLQYYYGPKGSGKSAMGESITRFFFSGKDGEGRLISGMNLNPGQCTPFSFFSRMERFRNCPILLNEFDENAIEDWKFGTLKASYDGEGREVGDGTSFKNRKTKIQKVLGAIIVLGQYPSMRDDGSVNSRSVSQYFDLNRINNLTTEERANMEKILSLEDAGLSYLLLELLQHRPKVATMLKPNFNKVIAKLTEDTRKAGHKIEARLLNNYSLTLAALTTMEAVGIPLPFTYNDVYAMVHDQVIAHNRLLKDNSTINQFWKAVEVLFDRGLISDGLHLKVRTEQNLVIKKGESTERITFPEQKQILTVRFSNLYSEYSKFSRERTGKAALPEDTILMYMKEQPYFIGTVPVAYWSDKRTSGYAFDYDMMESYGIVLQKYDNHNGKDPDPPPAQPPVAPVPKAPVQNGIEFPRLPAKESEPDFITTKYGFEK
jgi:DNA primase